MSEQGDEYDPEWVPTEPPRKRRPTGRRLTRHVPVRFDAAMIEQVKRLSDEDGMTVSTWIRRLVAREVSRRGSDPFGTFASAESTVTWRGQGLSGGQS